MDISCDVIRDILPLYAEGLVSDATKELVDDHLCGCDPCTEQLGILKKAAQLPIEVDSRALKRVEKTIRRRKLLTVAAAVMSVLTLLVCTVGWLNVTVYLEPEDAVISVEAVEDGSLCYTVYDYVMGHSSFGWYEEGYENMCYAHTWNTTRLDYLTSLWKKQNGTPGREQYYEDRNDKWHLGNPVDLMDLTESGNDIVRKEDCHHWYLDAYSGKLVQKLWGEEEDSVPDTMMNDSSHLRKNFWAAAFLTAVVAACSFIPMKPWLKELLRRLTILCGCIAFSQLFLTGGKFVSMYVSDEPFRTLRWIYSTSVFLTLTVLFWRQLYRQNRRDRGL